VSESKWLPGIQLLQTNKQTNKQKTGKNNKMKKNEGV